MLGAQQLRRLRFLTMGWECGHGRMHLNADWVILEPVDEHGRAVPAGQLSHSCLLTHLANTVQPLIRYELGDQIAVFPTNPVPCGSAMPVIEVQGRRDEPLVLTAPGGRRVTLPHGIDHRDRGTGGCLRLPGPTDRSADAGHAPAGDDGEARAAMVRCRNAMQKPLPWLMASAVSTSSKNWGSHCSPGAQRQDHRFWRLRRRRAIRSIRSVGGTGTSWPA